MDQRERVASVVGQTGQGGCFAHTWKWAARLKTPHPSPLPREREPIGGFSSPEFDWIFQVGVIRKNISVSPLSLWERVRVRGF
jgi:hypothetical protein